MEHPRRRRVPTALKRWSAALAATCIVALALIAPSVAAAQESKQTWQLSGQDYNTQQEAEAAILSRGGAYQYMTEVRDRRIAEARVELIYGIPSEVSVVRDWHQYIAYNAGVQPTEQALVNALIADYNEESTSLGCTPNTTVTRTSNWRPLHSWEDGTSRTEIADYEVKWIGTALGGAQCQNVANNETAQRLRLRCSNEYLTWQQSANVCQNLNSTATLTTTPLACDACNLVGNPADVSTGDKFEAVTDIELSWISFVRYYHSAMSNNGSGGFGHGWSHSHDIRLGINTNSSEPEIGLFQSNGSHLPFRNIAPSTYEAVDGSGDRILRNATNWVLNRVDEVVTFNVAGRVLDRAFEDGARLTYAYDALGRLATVTHSTGRSITLNYENGSSASPITSITSGDKTLASYTYNANKQVLTATHPGFWYATYHYEDANFPRHLTGVTAKGGVRLSTFTYDSQGRLSVSQRAGGADKVSLAYTPEGGAVVTDALGNQTNYGLNSAGSWLPKPRKPGNVVDSRGTITRTYYDEGGDFRRRPNTVTDRGGAQTKFTYSEAIDATTGAPARTITTTEAVSLPQQRTIEQRRDLASNRLILTRSGNREVRFIRNTRLQPSSVSVRDVVTNEVRTTSYAYCEETDVTASNSSCPIVGLLKRIDGARTDVNDVTNFTYYGADDPTCATAPTTCAYRKGDLRAVTNALGQSVETLRYDQLGRPLSIIDPNGILTDYEYGFNEQLAAVKVRGADDNSESDDRIARFQYHPSGLVSSFAASDVMVYYDYDAAQRLFGITDGAGGKLRFTLDAAGNRTKDEIKTAGNLVKQSLSRVYNSLGQIQTFLNAAQDPTSFSYDSNGNADIVTDPLGRKTDYDYDPLDRLTRVVEDLTGLAVETKFELDEFDQVTKVVDPKGLSTTYAFNGFGENTRVTSPDTGQTNYTFNQAGLLATKQDANDSESHRYTYDSVARPKTVSYTANGGPDVEYDYDVVNSICASGETFAVGRLTAMRADGTELKYCYNRFGDIVRKVQIVGGKSFTVLYDYPANGSLRSVTYPDGLVVDYVRSYGRIESIGVTPAGGTRSVLLSNTFYNPLGPVATWKYGNGRNLNRTYDLDYRPKSVIDTSAGGLSQSYSYNTVDKLTELKDGQQTALASYDYDTIGRLKTTRDAPTGTALETYGYDATGNRTSLLHGGISTAYSYPSNSHRLSSVGGIGRSYNAVGNTTAIDTKEFVYNPNERIKQVKQNGVVTIGYRYNAIGERVAAINADSGPVTTFTLYDEEGRWIGDYDGSGAPLQQAIWFDDAPVGLMSGAGATQALLYVEPDHLATPRVVIDPLRNVPVWTWEAKGEAFGNSPPNQDPDADGTPFVFNLRFPGHRYDSIAGLNYNYYRDYDTKTGRYVQSDPIGLDGGISTYSYAGSEPLTSFDPDGLNTRTNAGGAVVARGPAPVDTQVTALINQIKTLQPTFTYPSTGPARGPRYHVRDIVTLNQIYSRVRIEFLNTYPSTCPPGQSFSGGGVYVLRDIRTGQIVRSGRTNDFYRREGEHSRDPLLRDFQFEPYYHTNSYSQQRGLEQVLHYLFQPRLNHARPINPRNESRVEYINAAHNYLQTQGAAQK